MICWNIRTEKLNEIMRIPKIARERALKEFECAHSKCCYDASCKAVFNYWKFANSPKWKKMLEEELERIKKEEAL